HLLAEEPRIGDRLGLVVGHVDHHGDAAGRRGARAHADALLAPGAVAMHLAVDDAGDDPAVADILRFAGRRRRALTDTGHLAAGDGNIAALDDRIGRDHLAAKHEIEIAHGPPVVDA